MQLSQKGHIRWPHLLVLTVLLGLSQPCEAAHYVDVSGFWGAKHIDQLADQGILAPTDDGKFNPNKAITRAELATWLVKALSLESQPVAEKASFTDVKKTDPYFRAVEIVSQNHYMSGFKDGFRPQQLMQRGAMISILARAINKPNLDKKTIDEELKKYSDHVKVQHWAREGVAKASKAGVLFSNDGKTVDATSMATRGQTAVVLASIADCLKKAQKIDGKKAEEQWEAAWQETQTTADGQPAAGGSSPTYYGQAESFAQPPPYPDYSGAQPPIAYGAPYPVPYPAQPYAPYMPLLAGRVSTVAAGTMINACLKNTVDSSMSRQGEYVEAMVSQPIYTGGSEVIPASSRLIGQLTNVVPAKSFQFGANGKIEIKFTQLVTPSGQQIPLAGSVDTSLIKLTGGSEVERASKNAISTVVGAGSGAALGTAVGAIVEATSGGRKGKGRKGQAPAMTATMGTVVGTAIGGGAGLVAAGMRKGTDVRIAAGTELPIRVDQTFQINMGNVLYMPPFAQPQPPIPYVPPPPGFY